MIILEFVLTLVLWNGQTAHKIVFTNQDTCQVMLDYVLEADNYGTNPRSVQYGPPRYMHAYCAQRVKGEQL